ncbi:ferritin-like domain-containing protein [Citreimonas salinaria]|uniref:Ferritin-like metal-binding protein YciE n=1 Tax=Citreimonas salinaria TaxID=321339 RepID=A0A1H3LBX2_9RHOB|nr:ferritin-like domain-containing protein [Citreimonas salinaria]SDY61810.1 Ferritin-like metal-binding protein YciE [Citreimonas salinaria]
MTDTEKDHARGVFVVGLRNAHAMEKQALSIMKPQINRLEHYPEMSQRLQDHVAETETQIERLDTLLEAIREKSSAMKGLFLSTVGSMAALGHVTAGDEVLKNTFANLAFENYEIAAYTSLLTAGRAADLDVDLGLLEKTLDEERRMAEWVAEIIPAVTRTYIALKGSSETAKR